MDASSPLYWGHWLYFIVFMGFEKAAWSFTETSNDGAIFATGLSLKLICRYKGTITDIDIHMDRGSWNLIKSIYNKNITRYTLENMPKGWVLGVPVRTRDDRYNNYCASISAQSMFLSVWWVSFVPIFFMVTCVTLRPHDDVTKFSALLSHCAGIHRSSVNSPHKGQWRGALFSLICACINRWENNHEAGDLRCPRAHYDVIVMSKCTIAIWLKGNYASTKEYEIKYFHCYIKYQSDITTSRHTTFLVILYTFN